MTRKQIAAILGAIVLAVAAPILTLALLNAFDGTAEAQPPLADPHYKCYDISGQSPDVNQYVTLEDQFGTQTKEVTSAHNLCAPAVKYENGEPAGGSLTDPHFKSYWIEDGQDPHQLVNLTNQFGDWQKVEVGPAILLWVPTLKEVVEPEPVPPPEGPVPTEPHYVCYAIYFADPPTGVNAELETQFGRTPWEIGAGDYLCVPALKNGLGNLDVPDLMCLEDVMPDYPAGYLVNLQTQFPYEQNIAIGPGMGGYMGCVPTEKELVGIHYREYEITGPAAGVTVDIQTQFGLDNGVVVGPPWALLAPALKNGNGYLAAPHLLAYHITSSQDPPYAVKLTTQFGVHESVEVGPAAFLVVPADKQVLAPDPLPPLGYVPTDPHYECYEVLDETGPVAVDLQTQFGSETGVNVYYLAYMCAPAVKYVDGVPYGDLTYPDIACYTTTTSPDPPHIVNLWTQFEPDGWPTPVYESYMLCVPAEKEIVQRPTFSIQDGGPSTPAGGGWLDPADILFNPGMPAQCIPCANLGLSGCTPLGAQTLDDVDALSYGADFGPYSSAEGYLGFSVDTGSSGQPGTAVNIEAGCSAPEPEADEFTTQLDGNNSQYFDGNGLSCSGFNAGMRLGLWEPGGPPTGDDLDAIDNMDCWEIDPDGDQFPNREVYFSLTPGSPTLPTVPGATPSGADILVRSATGGGLQVYAPAAQLGLVPGDDVNGLCLAETAWPIGDIDRMIFDPDGILTGKRDYLFYTVEKSSPSIPNVVPDAATIMWVWAPGQAVPVDLATALGLLADNTDDVDAIKCVKGLVDIKLEEFHVDLPDGSPAPPASDVTLNVSEWSEFYMYEAKHYYGIDEELSPPSVTSMVGWAVIGSYPGQLSVRFNAHVGDICTDDTGAPVPCGEGGVAGLPWNPGALPNPPGAGVDSCKDGVDNDNDTLIDFADPDCVDIYDVHFDIDLPWCDGQPVGRQVQFHCKEVGDFPVTFQNIEMPLGADDIDLSPDGVENNVSEIPLTIHCGEAPVPLQDPTFSLSLASAEVPGTFDASDLLTLSPPAAAPPAIIAYTCPALLPPPSVFCQKYGGVPPFFDDVDAVSLGQDFTLPPTDPENPDAWLFFSVAPGSTGVVGTGVYNETVGVGCLTPEPEADEFGSAANGSNYQAFDGDGVASCSNPPAAVLGLLEPNVGGLSDDLDALDPLNYTTYAGNPVYSSLSSSSGSVPLLGGSGADIYFQAVAGGPQTVYLTAAQLGLDKHGPNTDDIDALCIYDQAGDGYYDPNVDQVWFSLKAGSQSLPDIPTGGASPADILALSAPGQPYVAVVHWDLGLNPEDDLDALKCYQQPVQADLEKVDLQVKPFYCADSDMDGLENDTLGTAPGMGNCCDGVDNDGDTATDGQDSECWPNMNEDPVNGQDEDGDTLIDEDPPSYDAGLPLSCPWNGDDDCDGSLDEDPKNNADDDGDCPNQGQSCTVPVAQGGCMEYCDEDPANGFLGIDNDKDHLVDEDGAGRFDFNGNTVIDDCVEYVGYGFFCEEQLEGVDDDGDTSVDEDPLDSHVPVGGETVEVLKWEQFLDYTTDGMDVNATWFYDYEPDPAVGYALADDFLCTATGPITEIDVIGSWLNDEYPEWPPYVSLTLSIHADVPADPPDEPFSHPGDVLWSHTYAAGQCALNYYLPDIEEGWMTPPDYYYYPGDTAAFIYECPGPDPADFIQEGTEDVPIIYWLDVQAELSVQDTYLFGWKTSSEHNLDDAVYAVDVHEPDILPSDWLPLVYPPTHPNQELWGTTVDLAFDIYGEETVGAQVSQPHYLVKEWLVNHGPEPEVWAEDIKEIDAPAWRADALEDGHTTCDDGLDNDMDGACDTAGCSMGPDPDCTAPADNELGGIPDGSCGNSLDDDSDGTCDDSGCVMPLDPECLDPHIGEERAGLHSCNDGIDNGGGDGFDEGDANCSTATEVSLEILDLNDQVSVADGVVAYVKVRDPAHGNKCQPPKIPLDYPYNVGPYETQAYILTYNGGTPVAAGDCIAVDSMPGVYNELDYHQVMSLGAGEQLLNWHQADIACEDRTSAHKFVLQDELLPLGVPDPDPSNNSKGMEMLVGCVGFADAQVDDVSIEGDPQDPNDWDVTVSHGQPSRQVTVNYSNVGASPAADGFIISLEEMSPGLNPHYVKDTDAWADEVEFILFSNQNDPTSTPENIHAAGNTCSDGIDNDGNGQTDGADSKCADADGDGFSDFDENFLFPSSPGAATDPTITPEHMQFPWTCDDGIDNDGDGYSDHTVPPGPNDEQDGADPSDTLPDCSYEQLYQLLPPVACASGWVPQAGDHQYVYLDEDANLTVGLGIAVNDPGAAGASLQRDLILHCFGAWDPAKYPAETVTATIDPQEDAHLIEHDDIYNSDSVVFDGNATCTNMIDLSITVWTFTPAVPDPLYVDQQHTFHTDKTIALSGVTDPGGIEINVHKEMDVPQYCQGSLHPSLEATVDEEVVKVTAGTEYSVDGGAWQTAPGPDPTQLVYNDDFTQKVSVKGRSGTVTELTADFPLHGVTNGDTHVHEDFDLQCSQPSDGHPYSFTYSNHVAPQDYPEVCGPTDVYSTNTVDVNVEEMPAEVDLQKADLYVKPFYCGDSDLDGREDYGHAGGAPPHGGNCCDGVDNDGDTNTDGRDPDCQPYINEDGLDGSDNDGDGFIDEDPPTGDVGCPYDGDDDCDGLIDEDPKNMIDDDGDDYFDEDPANGFLGVDNDRDGSVDEDGAGSFDWNGDTIIQGCVGSPPERFCENQLEGVDDDGDTSVDEDPLDSPLPYSGDWDTVKWEQEPNLTPEGWDVNATAGGMFPPSLLADDFICTESGPITEIDFWGSWLDNVLPDGGAENVTFMLSLHANFPGPPSRPEGPPLAFWVFDPGDCRAELYSAGTPEGFYAPGTTFYPTPADDQVWLYRCEIPTGEEYYQVEGTIYWLDLQALPLDPATNFGWKTSIDHWMDVGAWAEGWEPYPDPYWYPLEDPVSGWPLDLAFRIWGERTDPAVIYEPHYLIKELLVNPSASDVPAVLTTELDAPAWRADALEDGHTTCNDGLNNDRGTCDDDIDNDRDGTCDVDGCKGLPPDPQCSLPTDPEGDNLIDAADPQCTAVHGGEEAPGLHSCNDGKDNGGVDGLIDELDPECATFSEVSVECEDESPFITVKEGVDWYVKPPSTDGVLLTVPGCEQYYDSAHFNKCVPCKVTPADFYAYHGYAVPDLVTGGYCGDIAYDYGTCFAADSTEGVHKELGVQRATALSPGEQVIWHQYDLSCEDKIGQHKFIIQNEVQPAMVDDPNPANNELEMEMLVECTADCSPYVDSDGDTFADNIECYVGTDSSDNCTDNPGVHDAWPLDINMDKYVSVVGDVLAFRGHVGARPSDGNWDQRLDLNMDSYISVVGDVLMFRGNVGTSCA
jgi:hypothetical protein